MLTVTGVLPDSIAEELGFEIGDGIVSINGNELRDVIDYTYYDSFEEITVEVLTKQGERETVEIIKDEELGLEFDWDIEPRVCRNKCIFCFVDQLPKGLRDTLYVKDDDWRLSFITGSYITFTNVTDEEVDRICEQHISPLYVSVHAYDDEVRRFIVKNPNTDKLIDRMRKLSDHGIVMHTQVVMVKGVNDGDVLRRTIEGLYSIDGVKTLAIVPVGMTDMREGLVALEPVDRDCAIETIRIAESFEGRREGEVFVYCSDEMYIRAGLPLPPAEYYGALDQIQNGVGMVSLFLSEIDEFVEEYTLSGEYDLATGVSATPIMREVCDKLMRLNPDLRLHLHTVVNDFFGESVTVAGLITGRDIVSQLDGNLTSDTLVIPAVMLRECEDVFLDGMTLDTVGASLGVKVVATKTDGRGLLETIKGLAL